MSACATFKEATIEERWEYCKKRNACFSLMKDNFAIAVPRSPAASIAAEGHTIKCCTTASDRPRANIDTYALLDEGSTITLIDAAVAEAVGAAGTPEPFHIEGVAGTAVDANASQRVTLEIRGRHHKKTHQITAHTMDRLNLFTQTVDRDEIVAHKHLRDIANDLCYEHAHPTVLIGQDNWPLIITRAVRGGRKSEPAASYTELGWRPDQRALDILRARTRQNDEGRYETGLLWRNNEVRLPNNYEAALSRLIKLEKRLDQNETLKKVYEAQMAHTIESGYAEIAADPPREVHDAAARARGTSLNENLPTGPDLLQSLPAVLMRFRQHRVAVAADIKKMFLQIEIAEEDRDALRFLWRSDRREGQPTEYRMTRVIFGAASSPCTAIYVKNANAEKHRESFPAAATGIVENHYMDDYLQSFPTTEEAIKIAHEVALVHSRTHFNLQKWRSNDEPTLNALTSESRQVDKKLNCGTNEEKVLGLIWRPKSDTLAFDLDLKHIPKEIMLGQKRPTKREILRTAMSVFDPLGLAAPLTIAAKRILQATWKLGTDWDEEVPDDVYKDWNTWLEHLQALKKLDIPRCYPGCTHAVKRELHTFVDAS
ncbi:hypothetical protein EVAR_65512_1 [Eumeta japonica]|uniref:Uncharacterized protein n=1 Tax=Eumeta variegata TaxID=151549 RepID=A0A4C1ZK86_EUMVA|nr:hypothetical protein EVAR_65512_1 [Eumeta japonica]